PNGAPCRADPVRLSRRRPLITKSNIRTNLPPAMLSNREVPMPQSYTQLLYHIVYSTKERNPWLAEPLRSRLYAYLGGAIRDEGGAALGIGGVDDHIHLLARLRQDKAVSAVI